VTNEGLDNHQLFAMAHGAKEILGQREIAVVADMGYYSHEELKKCEEAAASPVVVENRFFGIRA